MPASLPVLPLASLALALGCVSGATGSRLLSAEIPVSTAAASAEESKAPFADAVIVEPEDRVTHVAGSERRIARAPDGLFYIHAKVNGRSVRFLVDTGATVTVLSARDAAATGLAPGAGAFGARMQTASGGTRMAWTRIGRIEIAGQALHGMRAAVVRGGLGVSLLGQNMLAQLGPVRIEGDRLLLG